MDPSEVWYPEEGGKEAGLPLLEQIRGKEQLSFRVPGEREVVSPDLYREEFRADGLMERVRGRVASLLETDFQYIADSPELQFPPKIEERFQACLRKYKGKTVMVRSNSRLEGARHSYRWAYQSEKVENVNKHNLRIAFWKVYLSLNSPAALAYREKNGITEDDDMGIDVQPFQQGKFYGVIHTSRSDYPSVLRITFSRTHGAVTDATSDTSFTIEFAKTPQGLKLRYQTENWHELDTSENNWIHSLAELGQKLEETIQHSELEFVIGEQGEITLLQRDLLRNVSQVPNAVIPESPWELLGETYVCCGGWELRGLPVVQIPNLDDELKKIRQQQDLEWAHEVEPDFIRGWIENVKILDAAYPNGYILVTTHFNETLFAMHSKTAWRGENVTFDSLTPHKRGIFTTRNANPASHAATRARESSIAYVGFNRPELSETISTGDKVSMYFIDGKAYVYREECTRELQDFSVTHYGENGARIMGVYPHLVRNFGEVVARELSILSNLTWSFREDENEIGGIFTCGKNEIRMKGNREQGMQTNLIFSSTNSQGNKLLAQFLRKIPQSQSN